MGKINKIKVDYFTRPILDDGTDGDWDCCNPIDQPTGLLYDPAVSMNGGATKVPDWYDLLQLFVYHGYDTALKGSSSKDHPMILAERSYNPPAIRQQTLECVFEELQVPAAFLSKDAVLSCYATGRTSATVIDMGYSGATVVPVVDGFVEAKGIRRNPGASLYCTDERILQGLDKLYADKKRQKAVSTVPAKYQVLKYKERKSTIHNAARLQIAQECRLSGAGVSVNTAPTSTTTFRAPSIPFELPDGTMVDVPSSDRFKAATVLFGEESEAVVDATKTKLRSYIEAASVLEANVDSKQLANESVGILGQKNRPSKMTKSRHPKFWQQACNSHLAELLNTQLTSEKMASMICDAAYRCDRDQQGILLGNVVLGGGGACIGPTEQAVPDFVKDSVEALIHQHTPGWRVKVLSPGFPERAVLPWLGGSILGCLGSFHELWISKVEYEEWGSAIVNRKCP
jgi:actin-related protein